MSKYFQNLFSSSKVAIPKTDDKRGLQDISGLSKDELSVIFSFLDVRDLANCMQTCRSFYNMLVEDTIWEQIVKHRYPSTFEFLKMQPEWKDSHKFWRENALRRESGHYRTKKTLVELPVKKQDIVASSSLGEGQFLIFDKSGLFHFDRTTKKASLVFQPDFDISSGTYRKGCLILSVSQKSYKKSPLVKKYKLDLKTKTTTFVKESLLSTLSGSLNSIQHYGKDYLAFSSEFLVRLNSELEAVSFFKYTWGAWEAAATFINPKKEFPIKDFVLTTWSAPTSETEDSDNSVPNLDFRDMAFFSFSIQGNAKPIAKYDLNSILKRTENSSNLFPILEGNNLLLFGHHLWICKNFLQDFVLNSPRKGMFPKFDFVHHLDTDYVHCWRKSKTSLHCIAGFTGTWELVEIY